MYERHPKFLGCAALAAGDVVHRAVEASDCIVNLGHDVIEKPPFFMQRGGPTVIHVSSKTAEVDPVYFPNIEVICDIANAVWQLKEDSSDEHTFELQSLLRLSYAVLCFNKTNNIPNPTLVTPIDLST